jgi:predicted ATPase
LITQVHVEGYRSIRDLRLDFAAVNVVLGPNGCGKTNLYRSLYLISEAAHGRFARALADEGGMPSALWAGPRRKGNAAQVIVGATIDAFSYEIACGLPQVGSLMWEGHHKPSRFTLDPRIKRERASFLDGKRSTSLLERENATTWLRDGDGARVSYKPHVMKRETKIETADFLKPETAFVSAVLYATSPVLRMWLDVEEHKLGMIHNPQATVPLPRAMLDVAEVLRERRYDGGHLRRPQKWEGLEPHY